METVLDDIFAELGSAVFALDHSSNCHDWTPLSPNAGKDAFNRQSRACAVLT
jgi:hypothetical protein